jgi:hypothetical protein
MDSFEAPKKSGKDVTHSLIKGGLGAIPIFGDMAAALLDLAIKPAFEKRLQNWMEGVSVMLNELQENHGIQIEDLEGNEEFVSIFIKTARVAQTTHLEEKRTMLVGALKNSILNDIEFDKKEIFLRIIEELSPRHFLLLQMIMTRFENEPEFDMESFKDEMSQMHFNDNGNLMELYFKQLGDYHLVKYWSTEKVINNRRIWAMNLTQLGSELMQYIS